MTRPNPHIALIYHYDLARALAGEIVDWQIIPVNVDAGREGGDLCRAAADFAKRRDLFAMPAPSAAPAIPPVEQQATDPEPPTASSVVPGSAATIDRGELIERVKELFRRYPEAEALLRRDWPAGVPTLKHHGHTAEQLNNILSLIRRVEAEVGAGWFPGDVTSRKGYIDRARKAWADSGRDEAELWFAATVLATYEQCKDPDCTLDGLIRQFTIEQAERLREQASAT